MNLNLFLRNLATQGAVGYGEAPGTIATLMTIPIVWVLGSMQLSVQVYAITSLVIFIVGWLLAQHALPYFVESDPSQIVIDEMVSFIALFCGLPITVQTIFIGFVVFRLLDIYKPFGIAYLEKIPGVAGVMLDDAAAALLTYLSLQILLYFTLV
ncbi:MAG: phosphatidylglycerophosphatase A [Candidatus Dependentiae bacterium]